MSTPVIFDRNAVRRTRNRAAAGFAERDFLFTRTMREIAGRLEDIKREFPLALQVGARGKLQSLKIGRLIKTDIAENFTPDVIAENDFLPFADESFDLVVSALDLHTVNDLPGALLQIRRVLKPDGLFLAALFGGETLYELRACLTDAELEARGGVSPRVFPFADRPQMAGLMQRAGFALPVVDSEIVTVTYSDAFKLMQDVRGMGENNVIAERERTPATKRLMMDAAQRYAMQFAEPDGRIPASFEIIFLSGWAPHESQQKPLRPGSANNSLAQALGTTEESTGEKTAP